MNRLLFVFFISISLLACSSSHLSRKIASEKLNCHGVINDFVNLSEYKVVDEYFLKNPNTSGGVNYQINLERAQKWVDSLGVRYRNEVSTSIIGKYDGEKVPRIDIKGWGDGPKQKLILTSGVHGNESAGVGTIINLFDKIIYDPIVRTNFDIVIIPFVNPGGLKNNLRRVNNGVDLNRTFPGGKDQEQKITGFLRDSLKNERFDLGLDLHEAPFRDKFFVIKMFEKDDGLTQSVLSNVSKDDLITSPTGNYPGGMYRAHSPGSKPFPQIEKYKSYELYGPGEVSSFNKGTVKSFFYYELGAPYSYTLEAPGQMNLHKKIRIYTNIVKDYIYNSLEVLK